MPSPPFVGHECGNRRDIAIHHVIKVIDRDVSQQPPVFQRLEPQSAMIRE